MWDSGKFAVEKIQFKSNSGKELKPSARYYWRVRLDKDGKAYHRATHLFETD